MGVYRFLQNGGFTSPEITYASMSTDSRDAFPIEYLVIAAGGGGGYYGGSGGGAGGYRCNVSGEMSGGGASAEPAMTLSVKTNYKITIGAGGVGDFSGYYPVVNNGTNSEFHTITCIGGGGGIGFNGQWQTGGSGGSGGGMGGTSGNTVIGGRGIAGQGFAGQGITSGGRGGGGAGEAGGTDGLGEGGDGVASSITGTSVFRAGGGGGGGTLGTRASQGGGGCGQNGPVNSGGGGGGDAGTVGAGGSGVVILRYPNSYTITIGSGLTGTTSTVGANKVTTITAGTGNVSWAA
jgi:hypothetical protein